LRRSIRFRSYSQGEIGADETETSMKRIIITFRDAEDGSVRYPELRFKTIDAAIEYLRQKKDEDNAEEKVEEIEEAAITGN